MTDTHDIHTADTSGRNPADDLALIRGMMEAGRKRAAVDGRHFVLWGALLMLSFFAQYLSVHHYLPPTILGIWVPMMAIGWGMEFWLRRSRPKAEACSNNITLVGYSAAWRAVGLTVLIYFAASMAMGTFDPRTISVLSAAMIGGAFLVTARVTGVTWLYGPTIGWGLVLGVMSAAPTYDGEMLLVLAAASGLLLLLPGQLMTRLAEREA